MSYTQSGIDKDKAQMFEQLSAERKYLQSIGHLPQWYTTQGFQLFKDKYRYKDEEMVLGRMKTIAHTLSRYMIGEEAYWEKKFFNHMWKGMLSPATPVLSNTGTDRGMNVSCSGQYVGDSVHSFYKNLYETAILSKNGFGTSADFSDIRPRGSAISSGGEASGPVPVMEDFFTAAGKISQGGNRRGAVAAYLDIDHPDWDDAVDSLMREPDGKNYGWTVRDSFVEKLKSGDEDALRKFNRAMYVKLVTGKGYFFFIDKANRARPQMYKDLNLDIKATNLCVAPETTILTDQGHLVISEKVDQKVNVWNGKQFSEVTVEKTGEDQKLLKVMLSNGLTLDSTEYHKWYIQDPDTGLDKEVRTHELEVDDVLTYLDLPIIEGSKMLEEIDLHKVPTLPYDVDSRVEWLGEYLLTHSDVIANPGLGSWYITLHSSYGKKFLEKIFYMLQTLGVHACITETDNKYGHELMLIPSELNKLRDLGLVVSDDIELLPKPKVELIHEVTVMAVVDEGRVEDTYCFTEPLEHKGVFNGILTGQCSEIMLHSSEDYTYSCILSSMNLVHWDEIKDSDAVFVATVFLDCLTQDFIENSAGVEGLEKVREFTIKGRAIGLGVMGFHTYLQSKGIAYGSLEAQFLSQEISKHLHDETLRASQWLAGKYGEPEWCKGYGVRNTHRCVTGDTKLTTPKGDVKIKDVVDKEVTIWNGRKWVEVTPFKTSDKEPIYRVTLSNGKYIDVSGDHLWTIRNNRNAAAKKVETLSLNIGDKLDKWVVPIIEGTKEIPLPYTSGFFAGDGSYSQSKPEYTNCKQRKEIRIYGRGGKTPCLESLVVKDGCSIREKEIVMDDGTEMMYRFYIPDEVAEKDFVPDSSYTLASRVEWLAGLLDADGTNIGSFTSVDEIFVDKVVSMAEHMGLNTHKSVTNKAGEEQVLNGRKGKRENNLYSVGFSRKQLLALGINSYTKRVKIGEANRSAYKYLTVESVEEIGVGETFCLTDPEDGTALFNGVKTAQCAYAPTKSTALLMGGVSESWFPDPGMVFDMASSVGELRRIPPVFYYLMKKKGVYNEETITDIINHTGSVQHVDWLTDEEKQVFMNAYEIEQKTILRHASLRQQYTCQGQSLNFFIADEGSEDQIAELMSMVFTDENILAQYYFYSKSGVVVPDECLSCSA